MSHKVTLNSRKPRKSSLLLLVVGFCLQIFLTPSVVLAESDHVWTELEQRRQGVTYFEEKAKSCSPGGFDGGTTGTRQTPDTLRGKIERLLVVRTDTATEVDKILNTDLGGILIGRDLTDPNYAGKLKAAKAGGYIVAADGEGGSIPIAGIKNPPPSAAIMAAKSSEEQKTIYKTYAEELASYGINLDFAPVVDLKSNISAPSISTRAYSSDPAKVTEIASNFVTELKAAGITPILKHFPGHGSANGNSDVDVSHNKLSVEELQNKDLKPYKAILTQSGVGVMIGNFFVDSVDPNNQAIFSEKVVTELLRNNIGHKGLVVSDDLTVATSLKNIPIGDRFVKALQAGVDMFEFVGLENVETAAKSIENAVNAGTISEARIDESLSRINGAVKSQRPGVGNTSSLEKPGVAASPADPGAQPNGKINLPKNINPAWLPIWKAAADEFGVDVPILATLHYVEQTGNFGQPPDFPYPNSPTGAVGPFQFTGIGWADATKGHPELTDKRNPVHASKAAAIYIKKLGYAPGKALGGLSGLFPTVGGYEGRTVAESLFKYNRGLAVLNASDPYSKEGIGYVTKALPFYAAILGIDYSDLAGSYGSGGGCSGGGLTQVENTGSQGNEKVSAAANIEIAKPIAESFGVKNAEWDCLVSLWQAKSGWDHLANTPNSQYGIPGAKYSDGTSPMSAESSDWKTNPATQIKWGLKDIKAKAGTPCKAKTAEQKTNPEQFGKNVYVIGDSLSVNTKDLYDAALSARGMKLQDITANEGWGIKKSISALKIDSNTKSVVVALGTNDYGLSTSDFKSAAEDMISAIHKKNSTATIFWVNMYAPSAKISDNAARLNGVLESVQIGDNRVRVIDWESEAKNNSDTYKWSTGDQIHLYGAAQKAKIEFITRLLN
jgi:beta-N-acetylhexosaminidase